MKADEDMADLQEEKNSQAVEKSEMDLALERDAIIFAEEVGKIEAAVNEAIKEGRTPQAPFRGLQMFTRSPLVLQMLGSDSVTGKSSGDRLLHTSSHTFRNIIDGHHGITFDVLKQLPQAMADPAHEQRQGNRGIDCGH